MGIKLDYSDVKFKNNGRLKLLIIVGTRPEIIRLAAVIGKCRQYFDCILAHTGQNYDYELNEIFFRDLELPMPDYYLGAAGATAAGETGVARAARSASVSGGASFSGRNRPSVIPAATSGPGTMTVLRRAIPSSAQRTQYSGVMPRRANSTLATALNSVFTGPGQRHPT